MGTFKLWDKAIAFLPYLLQVSYIHAPKPIIDVELKLSTRSITSTDDVDRIVASLKWQYTSLRASASASGGANSASTVHRRPPPDRQACERVKCQSLLPWSGLLSVLFVDSGSALKVARVGVSTHIG